MKILVLSDLHGDIDLVNQYIEASNCEYVLSCGDFGIFGRFDETKNLPKPIRKNKGNFYEYLEQTKKFKVPVITVYGAHENHSLVKKIVNKSIVIPNFSIVPNGKTVKINSFTIGGMGGTYSPVAYYKDSLIGYDRRHFLKNEVEELKKKKCEILLMHDLIGGCQSKRINFSNETNSLFGHVLPFYCFLGKYHWAGSVKIPVNDISSRKNFHMMAVVLLPKACDRYLILDTDTWDAQMIQLDISIKHENKGVVN